jgi:hypothetical protein
MAYRYALQQWIWTDEQFALMGWHDCRIHAMAFAPETFELVFDIDYLFAWIPPPAGDGAYTFVVAPATLVFHDVGDVRYDLHSATGALHIDDVTRSTTSHATGTPTDWTWLITCHEGTIQFQASGYRQYIRRAPSISAHQHLPHATRLSSFNRHVDETQ